MSETLMNEWFLSFPWLTVAELLKKKSRFIIKRQILVN